jgi:hypothetical protein
MRANANHPRSVPRERGNGVKTWRTEQWAPSSNKDKRAEFPFVVLFRTGSNSLEPILGGRCIGAVRFLRE